MPAQAWCGAPVLPHTLTPAISLNSYHSVVVRPPILSIQRLLSTCGSCLWVFLLCDAAFLTCPEKPNSDCAHAVWHVSGLPVPLFCSLVVTLRPVSVYVCKPTCPPALQCNAFGCSATWLVSELSTPLFCSLVCSDLPVCTPVSRHGHRPTCKHCRGTDSCHKAAAHLLVISHDDHSGSLLSPCLVSGRLSVTGQWQINLTQVPLLNSSPCDAIQMIDSMTMMVEVEDIAV